MKGDTVNTLAHFVIDPGWMLLGMAAGAVLGVAVYRALTKQDDQG